MITDLQRAQLETLNRRQRDCLRLVPLRTTDEIARELGLRSNTVDGYIKEARARLGGVTRDAAARMLLESEGTPQKKGDPTLGLADMGALTAQASSQPAERQGETGQTLREVTTEPERLLSGRVSATLFQRLRQPGEFSPLERSFLLGGMVLVMAIGFPLLILGVVGLVALAGSLRP